MNAAYWRPSPAGWLLQVLRDRRGPLWELACQRWSSTITHVVWMNAAYWRPSPAGWLLQVLRDRRGPLWEPACRRWSSTITRVFWIDAAHWRPSPAGWLLQGISDRRRYGLNLRRTQGRGDRDARSTRSAPVPPTPPGRQSTPYESAPNARRSGHHPRRHRRCRG